MPCSLGRAVSVKCKFPCKQMSPSFYCSLFLCFSAPATRFTPTLTPPLKILHSAIRPHTFVLFPVPLAFSAEVEAKVYKDEILYFSEVILMKEQEQKDVRAQESTEKEGKTQKVVIKEGTCLFD